MATAEELLLAQKLSELNAEQVRQVMNDIAVDVERLTRNSKDIDEWLSRLSGYSTVNPFTIGQASDQTILLLQNILRGVELVGLPAGGHQELVRKVIAENTMHYVTKMGEDMKQQLRNIALEGYNQKLSPYELGKKMAKEVDTLSNTRAQVIARTETMRANILADWANNKYYQHGRSMVMILDPHACPICVKRFINKVFSIDDKSQLPPVHPRCRCGPHFSQTPPQRTNVYDFFPDYRR
jgi:SPP1 gp7 family putative phage head morphogenesis protein